MRLLLLPLVMLLLAGWGPSLASAPAAEVPVLDLEPNPVLGGQVTAIGKNFCGDPGCSAVTISIETRVTAANVPVAPQGTFEVTFDVTESAGMYLVTAEQTSASGTRLSAEASLSVPTRDNAISPPVITSSPAPASAVVGPTEIPSGTAPPGSAATPSTTSPASSSLSVGATASSSTADGDGRSSGVWWALLLMVAGLAGVIGWVVIRHGRLLS